MKTYTEKRFFEWHEDDISVTLRNKGGSYGGGSEVFVVCIENHPQDSRVNIREDGVCQALTSNMGTGGGQRTIGTGDR